MKEERVIFGNTPVLDLSGLIPKHITNREQLNEWEAANILKAERKLLTQRRKLPFDTAFILKTHGFMFDDTWNWAGTFRKFDVNIGVPWHSIQEQVKLLTDDLLSWEMQNTFHAFGRSVRLHHRLVKIHPFVNGNGRHARLISDVYLYSRNEKPLEWPGYELIDNSKLRERYILALKDADAGDYLPLERFIRRFVPGKIRSRLLKTHIERA